VSDPAQVWAERDPAPDELIRLRKVELSASKRASSTSKRKREAAGQPAR